MEFDGEQVRPIARAIRSFGDSTDSDPALIKALLTAADVTELLADPDNIPLIAWNDADGKRCALATVGDRLIYASTAAGSHTATVAISRRSNVIAVVGREMTYNPADQFEWQVKQWTVFQPETDDIEVSGITRYDALENVALFMRSLMS